MVIEDMAEEGVRELLAELGELGDYEYCGLKSQTIDKLEELDDERIAEEFESTRIAVKIFLVCEKCGAALGKCCGCTECCLTKDPSVKDQKCEAPGDCKADGSSLRPKLGCQRTLCTWRAQDGAVCWGCKNRGTGGDHDAEDDWGGREHPGGGVRTSR